MKKYLHITGVMMVLMLLSTSCGQFEDELLNVDPNNSTSVAPHTLLTNSLRSISDVVGATTGLFYVQHMSETQYTDASRYVTVNFDFNGWYTGPLADLQHIIDLNSDDVSKKDALQSGSNENQIAVARILKAYFYHHMTDRWGPLPYSQALQGRKNFKPAYDSQEVIYDGIISELKSAVGQINEGAAPVKGDFLLNGNMAMWRKFANTLRMIAAMRLSNVDPGKAQAEFVAAYNDGVLSSDDDNIMYPYLAEAANQNPWFARFITRTDFAISSTLVDYMKPLGDPRVDAYADPAPNFGEVRGMPYGIAGAGDIPNADISFPHSTNVRGQDTPLPVFTYSQVLFTLAEAAHRGWISEDAEQLYYDAIAASWRQWGVFDQAAFDAFIAQPGVKWEAGRELELIGNQKWVALYLQGYEAWAEWRRLGWPALSPAPDPLNDEGTIPVRQGYPTTERDLNGDNYNAALGILGGPDALGTPLWWDK